MLRFDSDNRVDSIEKKIDTALNQGSTTDKIAYVLLLIAIVEALLDIGYALRIIMYHFTREDY